MNRVIRTALPAFAILAMAAPCAPLAAQDKPSMTPEEQEMMAAYQKAGGPTEKTSDGVERILGRPPRTLTEFARDYVDHFRG